MSSPLSSKPLSGTVVPMISPFHADRTLDEAAAAGLVERLASHRLGVFVLGTTGEAASIPTPQRQRLVEIAVEVANRRVPVFAGIGDNCYDASVAAAQCYLTLGVDAVVAHLPSYYVIDAAEMKAYFEALSGAIKGPLVLYNIPQATRMSIPVEVVEALADLPNVIGFKDSEAAPGRLERVAPLAQRKDFAVFMGVARLAVKALKAGYDGLVPSSGNLEQALWAQLDAQAAAGRWEEAAALQAQLDHLSAVYQDGRSLGQSLAALKAMMSIDGLCQPHMLPPLRTLEAKTRQTLGAALAERRQHSIPA